MRTLPLLLATGLTSTVVSVLPVVSLPVAAASPVAPKVQQVDLAAPGVLVGSAGGERAVVPGSPAAGELSTGVLEVQDFTAAGVTWQATGTQSVDISLRVREAGGWSDWTNLPVEDTGPDAGTAEYERMGGRVATSPLFTAGADAAQVQVGTPDGSVPAALRLVVIDPGTSPADAHTQGSRPAATAGAVVANPPIISRASWGADESLRGDDPSYTSTIKVGVVHHTAGSNGYSAEGAAAEIRAVYAYHVLVAGYNDIAYNFLVDRFGRIYEGRYGGTHRPVLGAHTGGFNSKTFAVSALGDFDVASPPALMVEAINQVLSWKLSLHNVDPQGFDQLTSTGGGTSKYPPGAVVTLPTIMGHRDVGNTACPGRYLYPTLPGMRGNAVRATEGADFSTALYADMLGRAPTNSELDGWTRILAAGQDRRIGLRGFAGSEEYYRRFVAVAYVEILGRQADAAGVDGWVADIVQGRATPEDLRSRLLQSPEFYAGAGNNDTEFVGALYQRVLDRRASAAERTAWVRLIESHGRQTAVSGIRDSQEGALRRIDRSYLEWLGRPATPAEQAYWAQTVVRSGDEGMREAAMVSVEYLAHALVRF